MIDLTTLTPEQKSEIRAQLEAEEKARAQKIKEERETYKTIVDETVYDVFQVLRNMSQQLKEVKEHTYDCFGDIMEMKKDVYGEKVEDQYSHTFTTSDGKLRIRLGHHIIDAYDDTVNVGIEKVKQYIGSLGRDENSRTLVKAVLSLLSRNKEGNLHASRVVQLSKMADESGDEGFIDAVKIIRDAHRPTRSKIFVQAYYRNEANNEWINLPLGITEA